MEIVLPVFSYNFVFKYTCIVVCFFSTEKRKYYMSCIWEPWKSLITNFLSRSVLVKSVLRLNQNFICPPWIIVEPEKKKELLKQTRLKRGFDPWMDFAYSLKQKLFSYEVLLRMEWGRWGGGRAGGYIILESVVSGIEEKANSVWIFNHIKKNCICGCPRLCHSFHASLYMSFVKV